MSMLTVIAVHGVWELRPLQQHRQLSYTGKFKEHVLAELTRLGVVPQDADQGTIDTIVRFEEVHYEHIGASEEDRAWQRYRRGGKGKTVIDRLLDRLLVNRIRRYLIMGASDVLFYQSAAFQEEVRDLVRAKIKEAIDSGDRAVTLVGHSLGSVVCYDIAYYDTYHNEYWREHDFELANLFTLGSPLALFSMLYNEEGRPKPKYTNPAAVEKVVREGGHWYNFYDAQDVIGYPLETTFPGKVRDFVVDTSLWPGAAHTGMWDSADVARHLAECLRDDYRRG